MEQEKDKEVFDLLIKNKDRLPERAQKDIEENIESYRRLIHKMARKYVRSRVEHDDLVQEAMYGLMLACQEFDPARSEDFHTYAIYRMKGKMYEYCIGNENPIYVPTHIAKAASYVKQMQRLLERENVTSDSETLIDEIIAVENHPREAELSQFAREDLSELKRKLGNIAWHSKISYDKLAGLALESLSMIVSDDVLSRFPEEDFTVESLVSNRELSEQLRESLGEKRFAVLSMRALGWSMREIAEYLEEMGYTNRQGERITRQAVKGILDETLQAVRKMKVFKDNS